jgi:predicted PurR-regulated permease PerM
VPFRVILTALVFVLAIAQVGPVPVLLIAAAWLYWTGSWGWATVLVVWAILVAGLGDFLRPVLIKKGADLPLLLIFAGVIGGLIAFGVLGLFIGPVLLAVSYTLPGAWLDLKEPDPARG